MSPETYKSFRAVPYQVHSRSNTSESHNTFLQTCSVSWAVKY